MKIIKFPDPILRERMPEFDFENPVMDPKELEHEMLSTMFTSGAIGLAANQVGIRTRAFTMGDKTNFLMARAYFNPEVVANTDEIDDLEEGCLSFPGVYVSIKRPRGIKARWQNSKGEVEEGEFYGYDCKVFLHELDHLEGIVFQDRVGPVKWALGIKKSKGYKKNVGR
jgi:peptide deformylase